MLRGRRYSHVSKGKEEKKATCLKLFSFPKHPVNDFSPQTSHAFLILWNTISVCFMFVSNGMLWLCTWECQNNFNFYVWTSNILVGLWIVGPKDLQVRGFLPVDFGATCALGWVRFMGGGNTQIVGLHLATASSRPLILGMPPPWILTLHWLQANVMIPILLAQLDMCFYTWHSCWTLGNFLLCAKIPLLSAHKQKNVRIFSWCHG
jgi:hypothetical protein